VSSGALWSLVALCAPVDFLAHPRRIIVSALVAPQDRRARARRWYCPKVDGRGRFAPSPTGSLHLGGLATAIFAFASVKQRGGRLVLRVEDLDRPRVVPGALEEQLADLAYAGLSFDEGPDRGGQHGPYVQSERVPLYEAVLESLVRQGLVYACDCSRAEVRAAATVATEASAPHVGEDGPRYSGRCRDRVTPSPASAARPLRRTAALRLLTSAAPVTTRDRLRGELEEVVQESVGDFVLQRADGLFAYQLAVAVDDAAMEITEVVRGADLASSAGRQVYLMQLLGARPPEYLHLPLVVGEGGAKISKRDGGFAVRAYRDRGISGPDLVRAVAAAYGHPIDPREPAPLFALARSFDPRRWPIGAVPLDQLRRTIEGGRLAS
jgi:glutamyl-tRNA synthetase